MAIPVPAYLKHLAVPEKQQNTWVHFRVRCTCGCERFAVYQNTLTREEKLLERPYYDALTRLCTGGGASMCTRDEDGTLHHWKLYEPEKGLQERHEEIVVPEQPYFSSVVVIQLRCSACGAEHLLFDSRVHGYDGVTGETSPETMDYTPHFRVKCADTAVAVKVENDPCLEEFREHTGLELTEAQYADAFSWIVVYRINEKGKKVKIFEQETA